MQQPISNRLSSARVAMEFRLIWQIAAFTMATFVAILLTVLLRRKEARERQAIAARQEQEHQAIAAWQENERQSIASIIFATARDCHPEYKIIEEKGWIKTTEDSREQAEEYLKLRAASIGANALIKIRFDNISEPYIAGYGKRGNPYYRNRKVTTWEACAVRVAERARKRPTRSDNEVIRSNDLVPEQKGRLAAIDGNNCRPDGAHKPDLQAVKDLTHELRQRGMIPHLFFDPGVGWELFGRHVTEQELAAILEMPAESVTVAAGGTKADTWIIEFALRENAVVVTNDRFRDWPHAANLDVLRVKFIKGQVYLSS